MIERMALRRDAFVKPAKIVLGFTLMGLGVLMLLTPGPGWLAIIAGLTLLASEYEWARRWRDGLRDKVSGLARRVYKR